MSAISIRQNMCFLFQGDSITDGARGRKLDDLNHVLGHGYAYLLSSRLGFEHPEKNLTFHNRGISGHRIVDLYARWQEDTLNLKPDLLSILIGVNDVNAGIHYASGVPPKKFDRTYRLLLDDVREENPDVALVLMEPFVLEAGFVAEHWDRYREGTAELSVLAQGIAKDYGAIFVPLQKRFDEAAKIPDVRYWLWDGVHPTWAGHELIARAWMEAVFGK